MTTKPIYRLDTTAFAVSDSSFMKSADRKIPISITVSFRSMNPVSFPVKKGLVQAIEKSIRPENMTKIKIYPA